MRLRISPAVATFSVDILLTLGIALVAAWLLLRPLETRHVITVGANDRGVSGGLHEPEISASEGRPFRWTTGLATIRLAAMGFSNHSLGLHMSSAAGASSLLVSLNEKELATLSVTPAPRTYHLFIPAEWIRASGNTVTVRSATVQQPGDRRDLGVALFSVGLAALDAQWWLAPAQTAAITCATLLLLFTLRRLDAGRIRWLIAILFAAISLSMRHSDLRFNQRWEALLLTLGMAGVFILGLTLIRVSAPDSRLKQSSTGNRPPSTFNLQLSTLILYTLLTILLLAPLIPNPATHIPGPPGDNLEYVWKIQWFASALAERRSPAFVPHLFFPAGYELAYSELSPAHTLLGLPLTAVSGAIITYNVLIATSFVLTALFTMLLAERIGAGTFGAFIAGAGVGFCLWRYQHILGQMNMIGTQWVVLAIYGLEGFLRQRRTIDALLTGLGVALAAWSSWYYGPTLWLLLALWALLRWPWRETRAILAAWRPALAAPLVALALLAPYAQPTVQALRGGETRHDYAMLLLLSARPLDYLAPSRYHALWGGWAARVASDTAGAQLVAPGVSLLILAGVGLWRWRKQRVVWMLFTVGTASVVMSLGPELRVGDAVIPLPALLAYDYVPVLGSIRSWSRVALYAQICIGLLAGLGLAGFAQWRRPGRIAGAILVLGVVLEIMHAAPWHTTTGPRPVDRWLAQQPGRGATLEVPDSFAGPIEYYTLFSGHPSLTGYGTFEPAGATADMAWLREFPSARSVTTIQRLGGEYVLVQRDAMDRARPGWRDQAMQRPELARVYDDETYTVYQVRTLNVKR